MSVGVGGEAKTKATLSLIFGIEQFIMWQFVNNFNVMIKESRNFLPHTAFLCSVLERKSYKSTGLCSDSFECALLLFGHEIRSEKDRDTEFPVLCL